MTALTPTVRDAGRPAALRPTTRPESEPEGRAPADPVELPKDCELRHWIDVEGAGEVERVALVGHGRKSKAPDRILKLYKPGRGPVDGVHKAWRGITDKAPNVVRLHTSGEVAGRTFEIMDDRGARVGGSGAPESARRTTLRDVLADHPGGLTDDAVADVVGQLAGALEALGRVSLAHLDLRPENVLVSPRESGTGWEVTVVDFGLAQPLDKGVTWEVSRPLTPYTAPELLSASVSAETDWWSLGMITAELSTGRHPFGDLSEPNIRRQLATWNVPEPAGLAARVAPLFRGLTTRDHYHRWGAEQVRSWIAQEPTSAPPPEPALSVRPFRFAGEEFWHVHALMECLQKHWSEAAAALFGTEDPRWAELADWLSQFDGRPGFSAARVIEHVDRIGSGADPGSPDALLLVLLRHADPSLVPRYRDLPAEPTGMRQAARWKDPKFADFAEDFWRWRLFRELDGAAGARELKNVDDLWRKLVARCRAVISVLRSDNPYTAPLTRISEEEWRAPFLRVAVDRTFQAKLSGDLSRLREYISAQLGAPLPMFEHLAATVLPERRRGRSAKPVPEELVGLLILHLLAPDVRQGVDDELAHRRSLMADESIRTLAWRRRERWREIERPVAMGWAAASMAIVVVAMAGLLVGADNLPRSISLASADAISTAWGFVAVGLAAQTACEVWLAALIGAPYHREYSLIMIFLRAVNRVGGKDAGLVRSALLLVGVAAAAAATLAILLTAPYLVTSALLVLHLRSARRRYRRWQDDHEELRNSSTGPAATPERQPS
ncbi:protein kinase [Amycolatopsis sp. NPDC005961]|uniref:protein kinase domain-containing protein n=1 Tax=Amycolatopsis sp. NPDC005961 TaxID=3156720 RepID=UPI0033D123A5